jgi:hypothetical protein
MASEDLTANYRSRLRSSAISAHGNILSQSSCQVERQRESRGFVVMTRHLPKSVNDYRPLIGIITILK